MFDNPSAFNPFFSDSVSFSARRGDRTLNTTVKGCVIDQGLDEPLAEGDAQSAYMRVSIRVRVKDLLGETPRIKDKVIVEGYRQLSVVEVVKDGTDFVVVARGVR